MKRSSKEGAIKVLIWHGQGRLDLEAAVEGDDDDDDSVVEVSDTESEGEGGKGKGKARAKQKVKPHIRVIITSYGVLASEHAKTDKGTSQVFESKLMTVYHY